MSDLHDARANAANHALTRSIHGPDADHEDFDYYRKHTAIALAAADAVVTVEMIAKVLADHRYSSILGVCACENDYDDSFDEAASHAAHQARVMLALLRGGGRG